ncbi:hypothetical protein [Variovorax sp.]|jgi:hypothetical protein|uniref:hypothetical protein n=1 Tax=Variovorax sp. TaxID=1871043 RepID=UPI00121EC872|nr:hypothetical protein [Variovorax sp.]TAJ57643.1 MAG: hypothetical protein EPO53_35700 [Variovorax sp.]
MNEALLLSAALLIGGPRTEIPPEQVLPRFEAQCVDGRWNAACPGLRTELELSLYGELQMLQSRGEIDREVLRSAARARFPMLAEMGLRRLGKIGSPEDREAVLAALDHTAPGVRAIARQMLEVQDDRFRKGLGPWMRAGQRNGFGALVPDEQPDATRLGLASAVGAKDAATLRWRPFASDAREGRAVFTTRLSPEQVLQLVAKGQKTFDGSQVPGRKQQDAAMKSMDSMRQELQAAAARGDLKALQELSQRVNQQMQAVAPPPGAASLRAVAEFAAAPAQVRYVQLNAPLPPRIDKDGKAGKVATRPVTAAVARDEAFGGETVLVILY